VISVAAMAVEATVEAVVEAATVHSDNAAGN